MTHVVRAGRARAGRRRRPDRAALLDLAAHGVAALSGPLRDAEHGGWFAAVDAERAGRSTRSRRTATRSSCWRRVSAVAAGVAGRGRRCSPRRSTSWTGTSGTRRRPGRRGVGPRVAHLDDYRGVNANMHTVEALLAAGDVTGDAVWHERAGPRSPPRVVHGWARGNDWRIPEHFDAAWTPLLDFNRDQPAHPFRPYGATVGSRPRVVAAASLASTARSGRPPRPGSSTPPSRCSTAPSPTAGRRAAHPGSSTPPTSRAGRSSGNRMHWVVAEAVSTATVLHRETGDERYAGRRDRVVDLARPVLRRPRARVLAARARRVQRPVGGDLAGQAGRLPRLPGAAHARAADRRRRTSAGCGRYVQEPKVVGEPAFTNRFPPTLEVLGRRERPTGRDRGRHRTAPRTAWENAAAVPGSWPSRVDEPGGRLDRAEGCGGASRKHPVDRPRAPTQ